MGPAQKYSQRTPENQGTNSQVLETRRIVGCIVYLEGNVSRMKVEIYTLD